MEKSESKYAWMSLISFALMYNLVYLGRFSVNNFISDFAGIIHFTGAQRSTVIVSIFASYAVGSFITGYIADRWNAKRTVVLGGILTSVLNIVLLFSSRWSILLVLIICNGFAQSAIWVGGIHIIAQWFTEAQWGKSVGIANFFSGLSHITAFLIPAAVGAVLPWAGWKFRIIIPIGVLLLFVILFAVMAKGKREEVGIRPYKLKDSTRVANERYLSQTMGYGKLIRYLFTRKHLVWWCCIAFLSSICRYGLLEWVPQYYGDDTGSTMMTAGFERVLLPMGMAIGTMIITWFTGTKYLHNKGLIVVAVAAICASTVIVFPMVANEQTLVIGIFITGFALYGINGILWVHAIEQGGRVFAGTVAGILNGCAYLGATVQNYLYTVVVNISHSYISVSVVTEVLCILMVLCAVMICKNETQIGNRASERDSKFA